MLENLTSYGNNRFYFCICGRPQGQKNTPSPKSIHNHQQNRLKFRVPTSPIFVDVINE